MESKWVTALRAAYSYGFNDKISSNIKSTNNEIIGENFPSLKRIYGSIKGTKYISSSSFYVEGVYLDTYMKILEMPKTIYVLR